MEIDIPENEEDDPDTYNLFVIKQTLVRTIEEDMNSIKIADRDYEESDDREDGTGLGAPEVNQDAVDNLLAKIPVFNPIVPNPPVTEQDIGEINDS